MAPFLDYMIDWETGGLAPEFCPAFQLGIVRFSIEEKEIQDCFKVSLLEDMPNRRWDRGTERFWEDRPDQYQAIVKDAIPSRIALQKALDYICADGAGLYQRRFWSKPSTFDWPFFTSYLTQADLLCPFHFRNVLDLNTYIRAKGHWDIDAFWRGIEPVEGGEAHDALIDCLFQLRGLFAA